MPLGVVDRQQLHQALHLAVAAMEAHQFSDLEALPQGHCLHQQMESLAFLLAVVDLAGQEEQEQQLQRAGLVLLGLS